MRPESLHDSLERRLQKLERENPEVARAAASYRQMANDVTGNHRLSSAYLADLYDVSKPLPTCGYDGCTELPVDYAVPLNPRAQGYPACARHMEILAHPEREILSRHARDTDVSPGQS